MTRASGSQKCEKVTSDDRVVQSKNMFLANLSLFSTTEEVLRVWTSRAHLKDLGPERVARASKAAGLMGMDEARTFWISLSLETAWEKYRTAKDPKHESTRRRSEKAEEQEPEQQEVHLPGARGHYRLYRSCHLSGVKKVEIKRTQRSCVSKESLTSLWELLNFIFNSVIIQKKLIKHFPDHMYR